MSSAVPPFFLRGHLPLAASSGYDLVPGTQTASQRPGRRQAINFSHLIPLGQGLEEVPGGAEASPFKAALCWVRPRDPAGQGHRDTEPSAPGG